MNGKIGEYIDKHFGLFIAMTLVVLVVGIFGGILAAITCCGFRSRR